jgi:23S rRNA pseudouridine1911/1915/1917 synthase
MSHHAKGQHHNAKVYHVTTKKADTALNSLKRALPKQADILAQVFEIGAVWLGTQRLFKPDAAIPAGSTLRVYISSQRRDIAILTPSQIIAETEDWLIVDKPAGLSSVPDRSHVLYNMTAAVTRYLKQQNHHYAANPLTRLDLMTSGLMLYAKHSIAEKHLGKAMLQHQIRKQYTTLLCTKTPQQNIPFPKCLRIRDKLSFVDKARVSLEGRDCHSLFMHSTPIPGVAHYKVILFTGRRHQIRCHAQHYLAPVLGDTFYGGRSHPTTGIALWASAYHFRDLSGKKQRIRLPDLEERVHTFLQIGKKSF